MAKNAHVEKTRESVDAGLQPVENCMQPVGPLLYTIKDLGKVDGKIHGFSGARLPTFERKRPGRPPRLLARPEGLGGGS